MFSCDARTNVAGQGHASGPLSHVRLAGGFAYVSGTSARRPDNTIVGADVDALGTATLDIRAQTRAVIENIQDILRRSARS